jgi:hypothetical protein
MTECRTEICDGMGVEWDVPSGMDDDRYSGRTFSVPWTTATFP